MDALAEELLKRYFPMKAYRDSVFNVDWQNISSYFLPQDSDINVKKTEGVSGWTDEIYDTTAIEAAETLRTGQYNWLTPPQQPWMEYTIPEELENQDVNEDEANAWLGKATDVALRELARSNFYSMVSISYLGVGVFGTDLLVCEEGKKTTLNFRHSKVGTYTIEEDEEGVVDTVFREFEITFRQAKQMFNQKGDDLPDKMEDQAKGADGLKKKFKFIHCIFPREDSDRISGRRDGPSKPIASIYVSIDFRKCVRVSGYDESPILCSRFDKWGTGAPYGYGPAYLGLPLARQLNYVQQYLDALAELHAYPRILTPDNLDGDVDLRAGGVTTWESNNPNAKPEEWATVGEYKLGLEMQEQRREALRDAFKTKAFKLLNSTPLIDKKMTAFEISQHQAEQLGDFTPAFARRVTEFLNPLGRRIFAILYRAGKLGQAPESLMQDVGGGKKGLVMPNVVIANRLTDALKALKNRATEETMTFLMPQIESGRMEALDIFDMDDVNREYAKNAGMAPDLLRPKKGMNSIESIRSARARAQMESRQAQMSEMVAKAGKNLAGAPQFMQDKVKEAANA